MLHFFLGNADCRWALHTDLEVERHALHVLDDVATDLLAQDVVGPDDFVRSQDAGAVGGENLAVGGGTGEVEGAGAIVRRGSPLSELSSVSAVDERLIWMDDISTALWFSGQ